MKQFISPQLLFEGRLTVKLLLIPSLNASVITASQNATLSNQGFCEGDKIEQPFSQEDVEYGIFLEPYNNKKRVQNE